MTASTAMLPLDVEKVYNDLKNLIYKLVHDCRRRFGGDFNEILSEAHYWFLKACKAYDPTRGVKIITLVYHYVKNGLKRMCKTPPLAPRRLKRKTTNLNKIPSHKKPGIATLEERLQENLSDDTLAVVRLSLIVDAKQIKNKQRQIVNHLCDYGWNPRDVLNSFQEIRNQL